MDLYDNAQQAIKSSLDAGARQQMPPSNLASATPIPNGTESSNLVDHSDVGKRFKIGSKITNLSISSLSAHIPETYQRALVDFEKKLNRRLTAIFGRRVRVSDNNVEVC